MGLGHVMFFDDLQHIFRVSLICRISLEPKSEFSPNLHSYSNRTSLRADLILVTLTLFSRSQEDLNCFTN